MILEALIITVIAWFGLTLAFAIGLRGWGVLPIGFILGVCAVVLVGSLQLFTGVPTTPLLSLVLLSLGVLIYWLLFFYHRRSKLTRMVVVRWFGVSVGVFVFILIFSYLVTPMITVRHVDVVEYLSIGSLLQSGDIYEHVSMYQFQKRMLLVPFMHAPANLIGNLYLPAITPLVALSGVGLMVWLWVKGLRGRIKNKHALIALIVIGVALLVTNSRFIMHATYMNGHLASGILLMLIVGMIWLYVSGDRKRRVEKDVYITVALIALSVLVFARPEGFMMALLAIVPAIAGRGVATGHKELLLSVLGVAMIAWHGLLAGMYVIGGGGLSSISSSVYIPILLGSTLIIFALMLRRKIVGRYINKLPVVAEAGLWVLLGGLFVMNPHILLASVGATTVNVSIMSAWGVSWIILTGLVAYSLIFRKFKDSTYLRFSITTFVPLVLLLAYARDSPYRVAQADSLDRMWMQVIPVAILYIITAFALGAAKGRSR